MANSITFPHLHLLVSGGNSQIIYLQNWQNWQVIGQTLDDAAGECLDKIGRMIGLDYPGGVNLAKIAQLVDENCLEFPIGMKNQRKILKNNTKNEYRKKLTINLDNNLDNILQEKNWPTVEKEPENSVNINNVLIITNQLKDKHQESLTKFKTRKLNSFLKNAKVAFSSTKFENLENCENLESLKESDQNNKLEQIEAKIQIDNLQNEPENKVKNCQFNSEQNSPANNLDLEKQKIEKLLTLNLDYSFSGLKTAVRYFVQKQKFENWEFEKKLTKNENLILENWQEIQTFLSKELEQKPEHNLENEIITDKIQIKKQLNTEQINYKIHQIAKKYIQNLEENLSKNEEKIEIRLKIERSESELKREKGKELGKELEICKFSKKTKINIPKQQKNNKKYLEKLLGEVNETDFNTLENNQILDFFWQKLQSEMKTENWQKLELFYKICICGQSAVTEQLITKLKLAITVLEPKSLGVSGGVSANLLLRRQIENLAKENRVELFIPIQSLTGDNAVMIALAGLADIWAKKNENVCVN